MTRSVCLSCLMTVGVSIGFVAACERSDDKGPEKSPAATASRSGDDHSGDDHSGDDHGGHDHAGAGHDHAQGDAAAHPDTGQAHGGAPDDAAVADDGGSADSSADDSQAARLEHAGLILTPDPAWTPATFEPGSMAPVAVYALPAESAEVEPVEVRITHFPGMKGPQMDQMNIDRWVKSVRRPDGEAATVEDAKITKSENGNVRLTIVDITGGVMPMMGEAVPAELPEQRLIAAIVDHPQGPHFVKVLGPVPTMAKWEDRILAFLHSAEVAR